MTGSEWQQGHYPGLFNGCSQASLMLGTGPGNTAGQYLSPLCDKMPQGSVVFIVYCQGLVGTKAADLPAYIYTPAPGTIISWILHLSHFSSLSSVD